MTEKRYEQDVYCKRFTARVLSCEAGKKNRWEVILDATAFFPEGGGQSGDRGTLGGVRVLDTHEKGENIIHYTDAPLEVGAQVEGVLDWQHRFDMMQNHTGEHIVSGILHSRFGCSNVGFHMGSDTITIDFDVEFSPDILPEIEQAANRVIWANAPVTVTVYDNESAKNEEYRSKKELSGDIRVVSIGGEIPGELTDRCACCGTHVSRTGEVGLIKLLSAQKSRGGMRLEMLSGRRALEYVNAIMMQNHEISVALSAKAMKTAASVLRLKEENGRNLYRLNLMEEESFARRAQTLEGVGDVLLFEEAMEPNSVRKLAVAVMERCGGRCAVFAGADAQGYKYAIGEQDGDLRALVKEMNCILNGRGGGKPFFAQGSVSAKRAEIEAFFNK